MSVYAVRCADSEGFVRGLIFMIPKIVCPTCNKVAPAYGSHLLYAFEDGDYIMVRICKTCYNEYKRNHKSGEHLKEMLERS